MKTSHAFCFVLALACLSSAHAADAAKVEYAERNSPFAPAATVTPSKKTPETNATLQERRVTPNVVPQTSTPTAERRSNLKKSWDSESRKNDRSWRGCCGR